MDRPACLHTILHTAQAAQDQVEAKLSTAGLSLAKLMALKALSEAGDSLPLGQLADRLACVKSNVTQLVDRLEGDGFVARKLDPTDRRTRLAVLTPAGRRAFELGSRLHEESERDLMNRLSREEAGQLNTLLAKIGGQGR
jgi:DNA-binding MarR family transcriptional regulator